MSISKIDSAAARINRRRPALLRAAMVLVTSAASAMLPSIGQAQLAASPASKPASVDIQALKPATKPRKYTPPEICRLIKSHATAHGLPPAFFARLIWKESRFDTRALSPKGAQGIAQFMPATARIRGLKDPYDPEQALPASASFLAFLRGEMGNLGLAAASYNAGSDRVRRWIAGTSSLPLETQDYVASITGLPADHFVNRKGPEFIEPLDKKLDFHTACAKLRIIRTRAAGILASTTVGRGWGVEVAGHFKRKVAVAGWRRVKKRYAGIVGKRAPQIFREKNLRGLKPVYSVRLQAKDRPTALSMCKRLRSAGGYCKVKRN